MTYLLARILWNGFYLVVLLRRLSICITYAIHYLHKTHCCLQLRQIHMRQRGKVFKSTRTNPRKVQSFGIPWCKMSLLCFNEKNINDVNCHRMSYVPQLAWNDRILNLSGNVKDIMHKKICYIPMLYFLATVLFLSQKNPSLDPPPIWLMLLFVTNFGSRIYDLWTCNMICLRTNRDRLS